MGDQAEVQAQSSGVVEPGVRRRAKRACEPCKARKRKCNGSEPCSACIRYEYECYFPLPRRKRSTKVGNQGHPLPGASSQSPQSVHASAGPVSPTNLRSSNHDERSMEANSGVLFPHILGLKLNPSNAPKVQGFGWNLGIHYQHSRSQKSMVWIISRDEWQSLFDVYIQKIHCVYGFLDARIVLSKSSRRWEDPYATNAYDHVLCGIAALACLFCPERTDDRERLLVECAKDILDSTSLVRDPSIHDAQAWLLRTLYLRCNNPPHAAWMSSCTTMHIIEAIGLHHESTDVSLVYSEVSTSNVDVERKRRTFWLAKLLNSWISFEYGRSRVVLQGASCQFPSPIPDDFTIDLISLFMVSEVLDPDKIGEPMDLEEALLRTEAFNFQLDPLLLSQSNLCFTIYRRLRLATPNVKSKILEKVIAIGRKGLEASLGATRAGSPWWHVSNVPFQFACIMLAMDTKESLMHIQQAISTLRIVADKFKTPMVQKALSTVESLIQLSQKRKEQDITILQTSLLPQTSPQSWQPPPPVDSMQVSDQDFELTWSNDLLWNTPGLGNVNWDQFWTEPYDFAPTTLPNNGTSMS
ncbi:hypothetical protein LTS07_000635 [Exophiala sideris]|uniref:Zn(2)-C6 fungal-type domain-containing protein n=1 Tax=Exophiala sideris TaxID=1016849 RepID=A0ABR0JRD5_9EURO|nr:hypothetical protein LTS07_000635 [Exophiala sideris]KAK5043437.1 hypothetical protein LTR13_001208 [Exophiala sideris]KAK5068516.1 hypothetical protein LTR69_000636 [Exophiala sideris]KAK5186114.1 hypothetical protein LTR44_001169 [Eurotiomycetes sp. CCFEE 6388]